MNICVFGDSIAYGQCDYENGGWVERLKAYYTERLAQQLDFAYVYNFAVPGATTEIVFENLDNALKLHQPEIVIFAIGINDSAFVDDQGNTLVDLKKTQKNIKLLIEQARKYAEYVIFVGLTCVNDADFDNIYHRNSNISAFDRAISEVVLENGARYIDIFDKMQKMDYLSLLSTDGLHPNDHGHAWLFEQVRDELEKIKS